MKKKKAYNFFKNILYYFSNLWKWDRVTIFWAFATIPLLVIKPLLTLYLPKIVIDDIDNQFSVHKLFIDIIVISTLLMIVNSLINYFVPKINLHSALNQKKYAIMIDKKIMDMDYEILESAKGRLLYQRAQNALFDKNRFADTINTFIQLIVNVFGFVAYANIISRLNPGFVLLLLVTYGIDGLILLSVRKIEHKLKDEKSISFGRIHKLVSKLRDIEFAKELRIYNMLDLIKHMGDMFINDEYKVEKTLALKRFFAGLKSSILIFFRDGAIYTYLIYKLINTEVDAGDVVLYLSAIFGFSSWIGGIAEYIDRIFASNLYVGDIRDFLECSDQLNRKNGVELPVKNNPVKIEISNLSFIYPGSNQKVIDNINLVIEAGEKIAIVGANGAGKTTLIKLICGLYKPTEGTIKINGKNIFEYNRDEYYSLLSVVFQESRIIPVSIAENVSMQCKDDTDMEIVQKCILCAGLYEKVTSLPEGINSLLGKGLNENATELSGGEFQKLMLARAMYKEAQVLILDEPTAALDPIAEKEMYLKYNDISHNRTAIFISHRLASTKFCDRIILLDNAKIAEEGCHDELMASGGLYSKMYEAQSKYYR